MTQPGGRPAPIVPYALELSPVGPYPTPASGEVLRRLRSGAIEDVIVGLGFPTGMTFGPDGWPCISNFGAIVAGTPLSLQAGRIRRFYVPPGW